MKKYEKYSLPARLASPADAILQMRRRKGRLKTRFKPRAVLQRWKANIKATRMHKPNAQTKQNRPSCLNLGGFLSGSPTWARTRDLRINSP
ncbi:hypothetical protein, partial [Neisseria sp.]|uniref:hypothetical protein n=1 Tax=Neisseria sp. TaxID=192066 RepID=UPI0026DB7031